MSLAQSEWKKAQRIFDEFVCQHFDGNDDDDDDMKMSEKKFKTNDEIIPNDETFVEWFCAKKKEFDEFKKDLKRECIEKKLRAFVKEFGANKDKKKEIKEMFDKIMNESGDEVDVVN